MSVSHSSVSTFETFEHRHSVKNKEENKKIFITALPVYQITQILTDYMCLKKFKSQQNGYEIITLTTKVSSQYLQRRKLLRPPRRIDAAECYGMITFTTEALNDQKRKT